jgi:hypothetical protein
MRKSARGIRSSTKANIAKKRESRITETLHPTLANLRARFSKLYLTLGTISRHMVSRIDGG